MTREMDFFIFLIEQYAAAKKTTADRVIREWDEAGATDAIYGMYERYHAEAIENAFDDIDRILGKAGK